MNNEIEKIDFNKLYKLQREVSSHKKKSASLWDEKAKSMNERVHTGSYNNYLIDKVSLDGVTSLLDVGCGPGTFALSFAPLVKNVVAFDFSDVMLEVLSENMKMRNINNIEVLKADIEGDWSSVPKCDVVIASRCLEVDDIKRALTNLNNHANKSVYLTYKVGGSFIDDRVLKLIKRELTPKPDYIYVLNVLYQMGIYAKLDFMPNADKESADKLKSVDEYINSISWSLEGLNEKEEGILREYFLTCKKEDKVPAFRNNAWALIYWDK